MKLNFKCRFELNQVDFVCLYYIIYFFSYNDFCEVILGEGWAEVEGIRWDQIFFG